jgi:hypothetical protein
MMNNSYSLMTPVTHDAFDTLLAHRAVAGVSS